VNAAPFLLRNCPKGLPIEEVFGAVPHVIVVRLGGIMVLSMEEVPEHETQSKTKE